MSHPEQIAFVTTVVARNKPLLAGGRVLEVGSYDHNGSIRKAFVDSDVAEYIGVDLVAGPGVDVVGFGHELAYDNDEFDLTISSECFEHDPHWPSTMTNMARMTRPGGLVMFTCATEGRVEHGTRRTSERDSPGTQAVGVDYYRNLTAADINRAIELERYFSDWAFHTCSTTFDLYFAGIRRGQGSASTGVLPDAVQVRALRSMMPLSGRLVRLPLRLLHAIARDEDQYQRMAIPYWMAMLRTRQRIDKPWSRRNC